MRSSSRYLVPMAGLILWSAGVARSADGPCFAPPPAPATPPPPRPRTPADAGYPFCLRDHTAPSDNGHYDGYYIGGGTGRHHGDAPCPHEGTWGWDYTGIGSRVRLNWSHGRRYQGGYGRYATEGPKPIERLKERLHGE